MPSLDPIFLATTIIKRKCQNKDKGSATGFFFRDGKGKQFLITNKHVIYGEYYANAEATPEIDAIKLVLHTNLADLSKNEEVPITLVGDGGTKLWNEFPEPEVDLVCVPLDIDSTRYLFVPVVERLLDTRDLRVGFEKIFLLGYPLGWYDSVYNLPIARIGHLSSPFGVPFRGNPFMLGDVETHPGMSGSPVFMELEDYVTVNEKGKTTKHLGSSKRVLLGIFSGQPRWQVRDKATGEDVEIPHSLSIIWFAELIKTILGSP